jgi:mono/diheme cytochrome c family protein
VPVPRYASVRPISKAIGGFVVLAEIDRRRVAVVADEEESALRFVDVESRAVISSTTLEGAPGQMLLAPDGTLFVAVRGAAQVIACRIREGGVAEVVATHVTADEPYGLALTPDASTLLVSTVVSPGLEAYAAKDLSPVFALALPRDPRSIVVSSDGARAFVTHATGGAVSVVDLGADRKMRTVSLFERERRRDFGMQSTMKPMPRAEIPSAKQAKPRGVRIAMTRTATQGFGLAMIGERLYVPETLVMTSDSEAIPTGYGSVAMSTLGTHVPFVAHVSTTSEKLENAEFSGPADKECFEKKTRCLVPQAVTDDGERAYVACLDSDDVMVIDPAVDTEHAPACQKAAKDGTRIRVENPSGLAVDRERAEVVVFSRFTRKLSIASLRGAPLTEMVVPSSVAPLPELVVEGRRLFHRSGEPRIAKNGRACASCHVDGREDALVWPTPLGKRQTPMLAGRLDGTAPYGWQGEHPSLAVHIKSTVKNLEGTGVSDHELDALAAYVASMHAPPKASAARQSHDATTRGQAIFRSNEAGCSSCHTEETHFTDRGTHVIPNLGMSLTELVGGDQAFDTPSLAFVGQTAPYFHDGRFGTLEELVDHCEDPMTRMGKTRHLSLEERGALVAYLRTL